MEYNSAVKKNEVLTFAATWMNLEGMMLNDTSQTEKAKYCMIPLICRIWKIQQTSGYNKKETDPQLWRMNHWGGVGVGGRGEGEERGQEPDRGRGLQKKKKPKKFPFPLTCPCCELTSYPPSTRKLPDWRSPVLQQMSVRPYGKTWRKLRYT